MSEKLSTRHFILAGLLILAAFSRLIPHPPNFTALGAMALFGGAYVSSRTLAIILPLAALWISDLILNNLVYTEFYHGFVLFSSGHVWVYISFIVIVIVGKSTMKNVTMKSVGLSGISASVFNHGWDFWMNLFILSAGAMVFGTTVYFLAAVRLGSRKASAYVFTVPVTAMGFSMIILGEHLDWSTAIGSLFAVSGVYLINKS